MASRKVSLRLTSTSALCDSSNSSFVQNQFIMDVHFKIKKTNHPQQKDSSGELFLLTCAGNQWICSYHRDAFNVRHKSSNSKSFTSCYAFGGAVPKIQTTNIPETMKPYGKELVQFLYFDFARVLAGDFRKT